MANDFFYTAVQGIAQSIQSFGADMLSLLDAVQRIGGESLLVDQIVFCDSFAEHGFIKGFVANHCQSPLI